MSYNEWMAWRTAIFTEEEWTFAHGLETGLAVIEESAVSGGQQDQHTFLGLHFTALNLRLHIASAFAGDGLKKFKTQNKFNDDPVRPSQSEYINASFTSAMSCDVSASMPVISTNPLVDVISCSTPQLPKTICKFGWKNKRVQFRVQ